MDPRIEKHAKVIVEHSVEIKEGDNVVVSAPFVAEDLVVALYDLLGERGANPTWWAGSSQAKRSFLMASDPEEFSAPAHIEAAAKEADVFINIRAAENTNETGDVPPEVNTAYRQARQDIREEIMDSRWVLTQYPASGHAQKAEMSTDAYEKFVWDAVTKDWEEQRQMQEKMVEILDSADEIRIQSGDTTDITMSVDGMITSNDYAKRNLPGGEVFTAPVPDSVEGVVYFDKPLMAQGREVEGVRLEFSEGEVVDHSAEKNEEVLTKVLETDPGARRLGELGIGMNRDIDQFTYNMLFDEKMGDTVHLALGRAYDVNIGEGQEQNQSAIHMDMIVDMSEDSKIVVDGEVVQRNGTFRWEE